MDKDIIIEQFTSKHIEGALDILQEYDQFHHASDPKHFKNMDKEEEFNYLKWILEEDGSYGIVATKDNKVVGFAIFGLLLKPSNFASPEVTYISEMVVKDGFRSRGIGEKMLKRIIEFSKTRGIDKIELEITNANERGIGFYRRTGFYDYSKVMFLDI
ncbi:MAG: GNAT family N-acetyltransferase [Lactobacillaceae bacterium]|nr:GNAT family N-acetyltransferase [Lactobacillaceae bacterium]